MGKRASSSSKPGSRGKGGKGRGKGKTDALAYVSKFEQLAEEKKMLETQVRKGIDSLSDKMGQFVAASIEVGKAPEHMEKARAAADRKDFKTANGHLGRAEAALHKGALPTVEERLTSAQGRINAIERLGVMEADLGDQMEEARKLVKAKDLLNAIEVAEAAAKRATELAQNQLSEAVSISEMLIKDAEVEGRDISMAQEFLEKAKQAVDDQDYEAAVEHTLAVQTALDRARKGLTVEVDEEGMVIEDMVGEEDREHVIDIVRRGLERLEEDIGVLEEIRGLVTHSENLASKTRKALEEENLAQARKLLRDAQLATVKAIRERLQDILNASTDRMRSARRDGLNIQEIRTIHSQANLAMDSYKFKEAHELALSIEERLAKVREEKEDIENAIRDAEGEIATLSDIGTNEARAQELMQQARSNLEKGDFKKAQLNVAKAQGTARTSTQNFINNYIIEVRNVLLSVRTVGGNIATARPMLITAKKEMNKKDYAKAVEMVNESIMTIRGVEQEYLETLQELMKSRYRYCLGESLGLNVAEVSEHLEGAFQSLKTKDYDRAIKMAQKADFEVEIIIEDSKTTSEDMARAKEAINEGKKVGADVAEADFLLSKAITQQEKNNFEVAQELLTDAIEAAERARSDRVGALLEESKAVITEEDKKGVQVERSKTMLADAEKAYKRADYATTIEMINEAIRVMGESARRMETAQGRLEEAEELLGETQKYAESNPFAEDYLSTARNLLAGGQYAEAYDVATVAMMDLEAGLVRYIDLIMEDTKTDIAKAEDAGAAIPKARDSYKLARRYLDKGDSVTALALCRKARDHSREILAIYQEVNESLDLLDGYVEWGKRVSRHLEMPVAELERANALAKEKKYSEAKVVVTTAIEAARKAQVSFVKNDLEDVDAYLRELESGGVGTSVARNTLNQAYNSLEEMNFEQAYTLTSQAREQGVKNQELYGKIIENLHKAKERINLADSLGVDTRSLEEIIEKTEKALVNQTYTFALEFVDQVLAELPKATQAYINKRFADSFSLLEDSRGMGLIMDEQDKLLERAQEMAVQGELEGTVEALVTLESDLKALQERFHDAQGALKHLGEILEAAEEIGVETGGPRKLEEEASQALVDNDFKAVHRVVGEAEDELIRTSSSFIVDYIQRVQETLVRLERSGAWVRPVEEKVDLAWHQLDSRHFTEAFATARECTLTLQRVEEHYHDVSSNLTAARTDVMRMGFLDVDTGEAVAVIGKAHDALTDLDFDRAQRHIEEAMDELGEAIRDTSKSQLDELEALIDKAREEGADVSSAAERLDRARHLIDLGMLQAGYISILDGVEAVDRARREMEEAVEGRRRGEHIYRDTEELGADISRASELMSEIDDDLTNRRYRDALNGVRRLVLETDKAKRERVVSLLSEGENAVIEAEELGLSVKVVRGELEEAERLLDSGDFHAAVATTQDATEAARDLIERFITARDRIVEVQSLIYDASGIGTNTARATDILGEARDALAEQRLDEALDLAGQAESEVKERQREMAGYELEALTDLREEAQEQGMVVEPLENRILGAQSMIGGEDFKAAVLHLREAIEEGRELLVKYQRANTAIEQAQQFLDIMNELKIDAGVPTAELERARSLVPEQEYDQAKSVASDVSQNMTRILDDHINGRVEAIRAAFARAEDVGIQVVDIQRSFDEEFGRQDMTQYMAVAGVLATHEAQVKERTAAYDDALSRIEEAQGLFTDAEELQVDISTASPLLDGASEALAAGNYADAASRADSARERVLELQQQFVNKYITDAEDLISELNSMGVDTIGPNEQLEQARAGLELEDYISAHAAIVTAITQAQEVKRLYNEAKELIEEARKTIDRAKHLEVDVTAAVEQLEQSIDSLEFQSYEEAKESAMASRQEAGRQMRTHVEAAMKELRSHVDDAIADGVEFEKGKALLAIAITHLEEERFIESQDAIDLVSNHLQQRRVQHKRTDDIHGRVFEELENAETLGVDVGIYESDLQRFRGLFDDRSYASAIPWGLSLMERLGADQRSKMDGFIDEVTDLFDDFIDNGGTPKQPMELLDQALDHYNKGDFIRSYNFVTRARESIETEARSRKEGAEVLRECRHMVVWADGMDVSVDEAHVDLERGMQHLDAHEYTQALEVLQMAHDRTVDSIATSARQVLGRAEKRAEEVEASGASSATVLDRVKRGRRSFEDEDYAYALTFGHLAIASAVRAEEDLAEAQEELSRVEKMLELARHILSDPSEMEALHEQIEMSMEDRHIKTAIKQARQAQAAMTTRMQGAVQHSIEKAEDDLHLVAMMELESDALGQRLEEAKERLTEGLYMEAAEIVVDVREPARTMMEDKARTVVDEAKEDVEIMNAVGAKDTEVASNLGQTMDMFAAQDFFHAHELATRVTQRAREVSDLTIAGIIKDIRELLTEAERLGVQTGELERRVEEVEQNREGGRFAEAKAGLDELAKDVDEAQRELVEGIIKTCDELAILANERDLETADAPSQLQEAHHLLSLKSYKEALTAARASFASFETVFIELVRTTLQDAKDLLVNLDVSADIESSSDHYVEAEDALERMDYVAALANADAAMANARLIQVQIIEEILAATDTENERGIRMGADMTSSEEMSSHARELLSDNNLEEAQNQAITARQEALSIQRTHATGLLTASRTAVEAVPFEVEMEDIRELLESSSSSLESGDFEAAADAAVQAETILRDRLEGEVRQYISKAEEDLAHGEEVGIDLTSPKEHFKAAMVHLEEARYIEAQEAAQKCSDLVADLVDRHQGAEAALAELMELIERATRARAKLSESMDMQEAAEDAMDEHDYDRVLELTALAMEDANRSYRARVEEAIAQAESNLSTLQKMGASAKLADELLGMARDALEGDDLDGSYDYADQSIKEAETAKTSFRDIIDITFQAESLIGTAKGFGMDVAEAQAKFDEALATRPEDVNRALAMAEEAKAIATQLVDSFFPQLDVAMEMESALVVDKWTNANLMVRNDGAARALRTKVELSGNLDVDGLGEINLLRGGGKVKKVPIRVKPLKSGEIMVRVSINCEREYDDKPYEFHDVRWLLADEEEPEEGTEPGAQFLRKELTCTICQGKVGTQEAAQACSCGATFHRDCADQLTECPNCGKSLGGGA